MSWRPSPMDVVALLALVLMLGGWFIWTHLTTDAVDTKLAAIAWSAPLEARKVGTTVDVSAQVCTAVDQGELQRFGEPTLGADGGRSWQFWYWGWLHCLDPAEHRVVNITIDQAGQCGAEVSIMPGMCVL